MRQKTIHLRNQGSFDKKFDFFPQTLSPIPRWVRLVQKTRAKNSHAWAPLTFKKIRIRHVFFKVRNKSLWVRNTGLQIPYGTGIHYNFFLVSKLYSSKL
jgi:hypothetical protein